MEKKYEYKKVFTEFWNKNWYDQKFHIRLWQSDFNRHTKKSKFSHIIKLLDEIVPGKCYFCGRKLSSFKSEPICFNCKEKLLIGTVNVPILINSKFYSSICGLDAQITFAIENGDIDCY